MTSSLATQIPAGVKDWLPGEARRKRLVENGLAELFRRWAYQEVVTPTLEYYETLTIEGTEEAQNLQKFIDRHGHILALRPDMTTPIARLAATRLRSLATPMRLFYLANVFRHETTLAGRQREFYQAGVELIGAAGPRADAEVIALAVQALRTAGLSSFKVGIGQVEVTRGVLEQLGLPEDGVEAVKAAATRKDLVGLEETLELHGVPANQRRDLAQFYSLHGDRRALEEARHLVSGPDALAALDNLAEVWSALEAYGVAGQVFFDPGILRDFDYYTGIVFEGYAAGLGFPVCGGGRYDELLAKFGYPCPATGFAMGIERVLAAAGDPRETGEAPGPDYLVTGPDHSRVLRKAAELRREGWSVEVDLTGYLWKQEQADQPGRSGTRVILAG